MDINFGMRLNRNFKKKDRNLNILYQPIYSSNISNSHLNTDFVYLQGQLPNSSLNQERKQENFKMEHNAYITYMEPWTKKFRTEFNYNFIDNKTSNNRNTFDYGGTNYDIFNPALSNNFENKRQTNKIGTKLIYEVKKYKVSVGTSYRNIFQQNINITTGQKLQLSVNNILPTASFNYRPNQGSNLSVFYNGSSQQPDITQMQPVVDNTDPNRIVIGNPDLKTTFSNNGSINYYFYKGVSDRNLYTGSNFGQTYNQISYATSYDSLGRTISQPINLDGNYYANLYFGAGMPLFKRFMKIYYNLNVSHNNNVSLVNGERNISQSSTFAPGLSFEKHTDSYNITLGSSYSYNVPKSNISIQSNQPYYSYNIEGSVYFKLPKKFAFTIDGDYQNNGNRASGYNLNYFILNASVSKTFFKTEDLMIAIIANDILNQNINNQRYISSNQIVDTKTQIIKRYFLLRLVYKFNSQKTKVEDEY
ncbi:MAG: outer membrane beta-barrel protein [Bacteroidetes bacterium]|nr:outer membrane beta-barrel protein [Bacteroidota bacterium]